MGTLNVKTVSKYFAAAVYVAAALKVFSKVGTQLRLTADNALALLFGPAWSIAVCGVLINNVYFEGMAKRDRTTPLGRKVGDVFGHVLPAVVVTLWAPDTMPITQCTYSAGLIVLFGILVPWLREVYVGVPAWVMWGLAPGVALGATHAKYWPPRL